MSSLNEIRALPDNWDGNGASRFSSQLIELVSEILSIVPYEPEIFPTMRDSIQLEWEMISGRYLELEIYSKDNIQVLKNADDKSYIEKTITYDKDMIVEMVNDFYQYQEGIELKKIERALIALASTKDDILKVVRFTNDYDENEYWVGIPDMAHDNMEDYTEEIFQLQDNNNFDFEFAVIGIDHFVNLKYFKDVVTLYEHT